MSSVDPAWLQQIIEEDEHGLLAIPVKAAPITRDERLVNAFKEICTFIEKHGRAPEKNMNDVAEFQLHARLQGIVNDPAQREALAEYDVHGVLAEPEPPATIEEIFATDDTGLLDSSDDVPDIFTLTHVPEKVNLPDEVAERTKCEDFDQFEELFKECHAELKRGDRTLIETGKQDSIQQGTFFVLGGVLGYIAEIGDEKREGGRRIARLRCIFDNGTEANYLLRTLQRHMYDGGKIVTEPNLVTLAKMGLQPETKMGALYVLQSLSTDSQITAIPNLCKIGFTTGKTADRIKNAANEKTYLNAPVHVVREYLMPSTIASDIESIMHTFFANARIDVTYERDGEKVAVAREWFSVPIDAVDEAVALISAGTIVNYEYDPALGTAILH